MNDAPRCAYCRQPAQTNASGSAYLLYFCGAQTERFCSTDHALCALMGAGRVGWLRYLQRTARMERAEDEVAAFTVSSPAIIVGAAPGGEHLYQITLTEVGDAPDALDGASPAIPA